MGLLARVGLVSIHTSSLHAGSSTSFSAYSFTLSPFLQVLNILRRIIKGAVEIVVPVQKVGTSETALLAKLEKKLTFALWRIIALLH